MTICHVPSPLSAQAARETSLEEAGTQRRLFLGINGSVSENSYGSLAIRAGLPWAVVWAGTSL